MIKRKDCENLAWLHRNMLCNDNTAKGVQIMASKKKNTGKSLLPKEKTTPAKEKPVKKERKIDPHNPTQRQYTGLRYSKDGNQELRPIANDLIVRTETADDLVREICRVVSPYQPQILVADVIETHCVTDDEPIKLVKGEDGHWSYSK